MNPLCIAVLDRDTLADRPFDFDFPHTLSSYGSTEAHQTAERIQGRGHHHYQQSRDFRRTHRRQPAAQTDCASRDGRQQC